MNDPIPLFAIAPVTWDVTDPWQFYSAHGEPHTTDLRERKWMFDCEHDGECMIIDGNPAASAQCATPIGYRLVQELMPQSS